MSRKSSSSNLLLLLLLHFRLPRFSLHDNVLQIDVGLYRSAGLSQGRCRDVINHTQLIHLQRMYGAVPGATID